MTRKIALAALLTALVAGSAGAIELDTVLGNGGELFRLHAMTYGEFDAAAAAALADDPVLVLEVVRAGQPPVRSTVPWTDGPETEGSVYLAFEEGSNTVFVAWERRTNYIHSRILLAGYQDGVWSEVIPVSDQRFPLKSSPRLAISRDGFEAERDGNSRQRVQRTVLHLVWLEDTAEGAAVVYAPILLVDGAYVGQHERITLSELFPPTEGESGDLADVADLGLAPTLESTTDNHAVNVGFIDPATRELSTLRISVLSGDMNAIGGKLRSHILDVGATYDWQQPSDLQRMANDLRSHILDVGARGDRDLLEYVAGDLRSHILDVGVHYQPTDPQDLQRLAGDLRSHILDVGFRLDTRGLPRQQDRRGLTFDMIAAESDEAEGGDLEAAQAARIEEVKRHSLPALPEGQSTLFLSADGEQALIAWTAGGELRYRETLDEGWSEVFSLKLGEDGLTEEEAIRVVRSRINAR